MLKNVYSPDIPKPNKLNILQTCKGLELAESKADGLHLHSDNFLKLQTAFSIPKDIIRLRQVHSNLVIDEPFNATKQYAADGAFIRETNIASMVATADCLPVVIYSTTNYELAVLHAGWRGLAQNIIRLAVSKFKAPPKDLSAWLGPRISQENYEVGADLLDIFSNSKVSATMAFKKAANGKWMLSLTDVAREQLSELPSYNIYQSKYCTYRDADRFFSYRRSKDTKRMLTIAWFAA